MSTVLEKDQVKESTHKPKTIPSYGAGAEVLRRAAYHVNRACDELADNSGPPESVIETEYQRAFGLLTIARDHLQQLANKWSILEPNRLGHQPVEATRRGYADGQ